MKYRILVASCVTILTFACSRPDVEIPVGVQTQDMQDVTFDVDYENGATKSFYVGSTHTVRFQTGDSLAVWNGSPFRVISMGKQATLGGAINAPDTPRLMVFPLSDVLEFPSNDSAKIALPAVQEAVSGGFAPKTNVSVGWMVPQSTKVTFRNCLSYIRFDRRGDGPLWNAIEVEALGGEALSGEFLMGRDAVLRPGANTSSRVRLEGEINFINYMLLGIPSGEYKKGLKVTFLYDGYELFSRTISPTEFVRSEIRSFGGVQHPEYKSINKSANKTIEVLEKNTEKGLNLVMLGDGFSDRQIASGLYRHLMMQAVEQIFSEPIMQEMRSHINVYLINVVSDKEGVCNGSVFGIYTNGQEVSNKTAGADKIKSEYLKAMNLTEKNTVVCCLVNTLVMTGSTVMYQNYTGKYGEGLTVSFCPLKHSREDFCRVLTHEVAGHGVGKLGDEYDNINSSLPLSKKLELEAYHNVGWCINVDKTSNPKKVQWSEFISDASYSSEGIGVYEGAYGYSSGAYRSTDMSIMYFNGDFNAVSRRAIYRRVMSVTQGTKYNDSYSTFKAFDKLLEKKYTPTLKSIPAGYGSDVVAGEHLPPTIVEN